MASRRLQLVLNLDTGGYSGRLTRAGAEMQRFQGRVDASTRSMRQMQNGFEGLRRTAGRPLDTLRDYVLVMGNLRLAMLAITAIGGGLIGSMVKQSAQIERMTILMKGLSDSTDEATRSFEAQKNVQTLFDMSRRNAIVVKDLTDAYVKMKSGGIDPMKGSLEALTDAVSFFGGSSEVMHRASIAIQQMAGKGVISMEELRQQLGEAVPTAMKDMARAMGMPVKEFTKLVGDGKVQAKPALELMFREFDLLYRGAGERMAQTLTGQWAIFQTNMTQLSTLFTGQTSADIAEQSKLFEEGKITWQEYQEALQPVEGGLFAQLRDGLKEINEAMDSRQAQVFMADMGRSLGTILKFFADLVRVAIEWKDEIWTAVKVVATGFALIKTAHLAKWFKDLGVSAVSALGSVNKSTSQTAQSINSLSQRLQSHGKDWQILADRKQRHVGMLRNLAAARGQQMASLGQEATKLRDLSNTYAAQIPLLERQRQAHINQLNTARTLHKANIALGRDTTNSLQAMSQAAANLNRTNQTLANTKKRLATTNTQLAATERGLAAATTACSAAVARSNVLMNASTVAARAKAVAFTTAAAAARGLGVAVNFALGPIGAIATLLLGAAWAAGVFESAADKAATAAAQLAQGIASLENIKEVSGQVDSLRDRNEFLSGQIERLEGARDPVSQQALARFKAERDENNKTIEKYNRDLQYGANVLERDIADRTARRALANRDQRRLGRSNEANVLKGQLERGEIDQKEYDRRTGQIRERDTRDDEALVAGWEAKSREFAAKGMEREARAALDVARQIKEATSATVDLTAAQEDLRIASVGAGKETSKKLTEAEKAAKRLATEIERAHERYDNMITNNVGEIARLEEELAGGETALAKFNALVAAGKYDHIKPEQIAKLAEQFAEIDRLNGEIAAKRSMDRLSKDIAKARGESDQMWSSLLNGTFDADMRLAQVRSQFEHLLDGVTDPAKRAELEKLMDILTTERVRGDATEVLRNWEEETQEILISLMDEDEQREANYDREVARLKSLVDWTRLTAEQRLVAEQRFNELTWAMRQRHARANENAVVKMARDWGNLAAGIDQVMTGALDGFVEAVHSGNPAEAFASLAEDIIKHLAKIILQATIAYAILSAIGGTKGMSYKEFMVDGFQKWSGGFGGGKHETQGGMPSAHNSWGSVVPDGFPDDLKRHTGGWFGSRALKPGEVPIIGLEDEVALTPAQQRFYGRAFEAAIAGQNGSNVEINIINNSGTDVTAEQSEPRFDGKKMILDVVVEAMNKQGPLRDGIERLAGKNG